MADIVRGVAKACEESGWRFTRAVKLLEMAGFYDDEDYDVAGFAVGIVDRPKLITGEIIRQETLFLVSYHLLGSF